MLHSHRTLVQQPEAAAVSSRRLTQSPHDLDNMLFLEADELPNLQAFQLLALRGNAAVNCRARVSVPTRHTASTDPEAGKQ